MKKRLLYIIGLTLTLSVTMSSCLDEWLTLVPEDEIVEENFWQNGSQVESVVLSCYRFLTSSNVMTRVLVWGEVRSDNLDDNRASTDENRLMTANIMATNGLTKWDDFYKIINICNLVMEDAPKVMERDIDFQESEMQVYQSEVLTIRALCYFYLIRTFGDVPMPLKATRTGDDEFAIPQTPEKEILRQIISDLELAEGYAQQEWATTALTKGRVTKNTVRALLADVYLWDGQYGKCIEACDRVLNDRVGELLLVDGNRVANSVFYSGNSTESIFELNFTTSGQMNTATSTLYGNSNKNATAHFKVTPSLLEALKITDNVLPDAVLDYRSKDNVVISGGNNLIFKYEGNVPPSDFTVEARSSFSYRSASSTANWIFYRLSDIYLMRAEALVENNPSEDNLREALTMVNRVYGRATLDKDAYLFDDYSTADKMRTLVLEERRREFCFEGKRWFDLVRMVRREGNTTGAWNILSKKYTEDVLLIQNKMSMIEAWYLPINQDQMNLNKNLHQNAYYSTQE